MKKYFYLSLITILTGCVTVEHKELDLNAHSVKTIDEIRASNCVYLFSTSIEVEAYDSTTAAAYAMVQLKNQALITNGNAIRVTDVRNSKEWEYGYGYSSYSNGYEVDAFQISVEVYNCPERFKGDDKGELETATLEPGSDESHERSLGPPVRW